MYLYQNRVTKETYITHSEIRRAFPNHSLPSSLTDTIITNLGVDIILQPETIEEWKAFQLDTIKKGTVDAIEALTWRIERAKERGTIGADGETVEDVFREREALRRASNRAEGEVQALDDLEALETFQWEVTPSDYPPNTILTRLTFMRRFTNAEREVIRTARDSGQSQDLLDFWELLQLATNINITDPDIQAGVQMLETDGLLAAGRAAEILAYQP